MQQIVDSQQLKDILESSRRILLTCSKNHTLDQVSSVIALYQALTFSEREVTLLIEDFNPEKWSQFPEANEVKSNLEPRSLHLSIEYPPSSVEKINYENKEGVFELFFTPYTSNFSKEQVNFSYSGLDYDLILTIGVKNLEELNILNREYSQSLKETTIVNIDNQEDNAQFGKINLVDSSAETCAQPVYDVIKALNAPISRESATLLLAAVMGETEVMKKEVSSRLLRFGALLLDKEADWEKSQALASEMISEEIPPLPEEVPETIPPEETPQPITPLAHEIEKEFKDTSPAEETSTPPYEESIR